MTDEKVLSHSDFTFSKTFEGNVVKVLATE